MSTPITPIDAPPTWHRNALLAGGGLALAGLGLAAGLMLRHPAPSAPDSSAPQTSVAASAVDEATARANQLAPAQTDRKEASSRAPAIERHTTRRYDTPTQGTTSTQPVAVCTTCGVVESVHAVQQRGQGTGLGAVAGGVLGGVVGNQVGKGQGNAAMTVLGALGGGYVGNEVEKTQRAHTVYEVRVRMDDGSVHTFTQRSELAPGARVRVNGQTLQVSE